MHRSSKNHIRLFKKLRGRILIYLGALTLFKGVVLENLSNLVISTAHSQLSHIENLEKFEESDHDLSEHFKHHFELGGENLLNSKDIAELKKYKIIFIPGYFSDFTVNWTPVKYFKSAQDVLLKRGLIETIDFERKLLYSQSPTEENIPYIKDWIEQSPKKVIIIGHSKGGRDTLMTIAKHPSLQSKVAGIITIQSPFKGTPLASAISNSYWMSLGFNSLLRLMGGHRDSLLEFNDDIACAQFEKIKNDLHQFEFPIVNFASYLYDNQDMSIFVLRPFYNMMKGLYEKNNVLSDGLVPTLSALLPENKNIYHIIAGGYDHTDLVVSYGSRGQRKKFFESILKTFVDNVLLKNK